MRKSICLFVLFLLVFVVLNSSPGNKPSFGVEMLGYPMLSGPTLTMELPFDNVRYHLNAHVGLGVVNIVREEYTNYYSLGIGANYFFNGKNNGPYAGATVEFGRAEYMYKDYYIKPILWTEQYKDVNYVSFLTNVGYNFQYASGAYLRLGGNMGAKFAKEQKSFFVWNPHLLVGYAF